MSHATEPSGARIRQASEKLFGRTGLGAATPTKAHPVMTNEGPRGYSTRAAVYMRHVAYFLTLIVGCALTHHAMQAAGPYSVDGGLAMFILATLTLVIGAGGTIFYPYQRSEILEQVRHYVFGLMVLPGTVIALIMWGVSGMVAAQANPDAFSRTVDIGLLMAFGAALIMPPVIFIKLMAGLRSLHRATRDDQETLELFTRQDGRQS